MGTEKPAVQLMDSALFDDVLERARRSPRRRMNHNFHGDLAQNPSRLLNVLVRGTYITPHRHLEPPKPEAFIVLQGQIAFFVFDDEGQVEGRFDLEAGGAAPGIDIGPGIWHTLAAVTPHAVCFEVKPGPYVATTDKGFAPWAPGEGEDGAAAYLERLLTCVQARR